MIDYIYDGTFDGLLTVIHHHYYTDRAAGIFTEGLYQPSFLHDSMVVTTDTAKADKVYQAIRTKISEYDLRSVYRAWLSCDPEKEMKILRYVVLGFREGHRTFSLHGDPVVADFQAILKKISQESERMLQFVRFSVVDLPRGITESLPGPDQATGNANARLAAGDAKAWPIGLPACDAKAGPIGLPAAAGEIPAGPASASDQILYARIQPDNDVIALAAHHFSDRFRNERLIIHDVGRNKAVIAYRGRWIVSAFSPEQIQKASAEEMEWRRLWKQYFDHIAIMERKNTRCQNNFIPDRYRKHLTEIITPDEDTFRP